MKAFVTGATGFIGSHMCDLLLEKGFEVWGTYYSDSDKANVAHLKGNKNFTLVQCDMRDKDRVSLLLKQNRPDAVFHLAAQAFVVPSWEDPWLTFDTNVQGTITLFEALKDRKDVKVVVASSSASYGDVNEPPFKETDLLQPNTPYGVSKATQDLLAYQYWRNYGLNVVRARIFNTTGPRKTGDVHANFAQQIAEIEKGKRSVMLVGSLDTKREVNHVKDLCELMWLMFEKAPAGEAYNCSNGVAYSVEEMLKAYVSFSAIPVTYEQDPSRVRATDEKLVLGDPSKAKRELAWKPKHSMKETLEDVLNYWRERTNTP
ncbi:MAG TPA: GDP-mannose 4,6-dehydratase [archaeon]|nr:GDP-mannose 4,6-dehydratase [archaeon]